MQLRVPYLLVWLLLWCGPAAGADLPPVPEGGTVLQNGDFEAGKTAWWGSGTWDVRDEAGVKGSKALRVEKGFSCQDKRAVKARQNYRIRMDVRAEGTAEGAIYVQISYRGAGSLGGWFGPLQVNLGGRSEPAVLVTGGTCGWTEHSIVVQAPTGASEILIYLRKQDGPGAAFFDNVRIEPTDERPFTMADRRREELAVGLLKPGPKDLDVPAALAAALASGSGKAQRFALAETGTAVCRIHTSSSADVITLGAVKELAHYLGAITGGDFRSISHDGYPADGPLLIVGRENALAARLCNDVNWEKLGDDGFVMRTTGRHLIIAGATPRGNLYGVYWFLDRVLGVRWLSPEYTYVPSSATLTVEPLKEEHVPHFAYREVLSAEGSDAAFASHNLLNGRSHGPSYAPTAPEIDCWVHDWMAKGGSANFHELLNKDGAGKAHPEWFAGGQVAMMDQGMRKAMARAVIDRLKAHPDYTKIWFNIWQMDWGWDMDPASKAFAAAHGGQASAPRLDMMIDVADQVRAELPGARLAMQAYSWGFTPPEGMTVPDYLLIFPMTIHVDYSTSLCTGRNGKLGADIVGWTKIAKNVQVWDHIANWAGFLQPAPNLYPIGESIQWLGTLPGLRGYFCEGNWNSAGGEFGSLRAWLIARKTWDPTLDHKALIDDYCRTYYGKAGTLVRTYIDLLHATAAKSGDICGQRYLPDLPMYDLDFVTAADGLFNQAERAVSDDPERLAHVRQARMPVDYLILLRRGEYSAAAAQRGLTWQVDTAARRTRFDRALKENKVREYRQGGGLEELAALLNVERVIPKPPEMVRDLPAADWVDIQDLAFMRYDTAWIVADPAASDGAAIRMSGRSSSWAIQLPVERVPKDGNWDLFAAVRVEAEAGHDGEPGVQVGSAPPFGLFNTGKIKELNDGAYHFIKVPGGPHRWRGDDRLKSIYLQAPAKPYIKCVYLDRIVAVRTKPAP